jgi:hypothetical protein
MRKDRITAVGVELQPVQGVIDGEGTWQYPPLDLVIPAPPGVVHRDTHSESVERARHALDLGLASAAATLRHGKSGSLQQLLRIAPLPATVSAPVAYGLAGAVRQAATLMGRKLGWPLLGAATTWFGLELAEQPVLALLASLVFVILLSMLIHEFGHVVAFRALNSGAPALFSARVGRFRLIRNALPRSHDIAVTSAGPAAPLLLPVLLLPGYSWFPLQFWISIAVALSHLCLLIRRDGDGAMLRKALHERQSQRPGG